MVRVVSATAFLCVALFGCGGATKEPDAPIAPVATIAPPVARPDVCVVPKSDMCLQFDRHEPEVNGPACHEFRGGILDESGTCAKERRLGSCRVAADHYDAFYFAGDNNDVLDSREHCQETLHGVFKNTPTEDIVATWGLGDLTDVLAGYRILMPPRASQERAGDSLALERFTGYYGIIIDRGKMSVEDEKADAQAGSEYFQFESFVTDTPTRIVWKVRATKGGALGYKFAVNVTVGGKDFTCESLTVFDDEELLEANIQSCMSLRKKERAAP